MKILCILPSINAVTGGPASAALAQARAFAELGHEVEMLTTRWPDRDGEGEGDGTGSDGVKVRVFPTTALPGPLAGAPHSPALLGHLDAARRRADICHVHSLWNPLITAAMVRLRRAGAPYAVTCHGMLDPVVFARRPAAKRIWAALWERRNLEAAELVHFTAEAELAKARASGWRLRRTIVAPNPVDLAAAARLPPRIQIEGRHPQLAGREVVVFVGRLNWVKNLDLLIAATARLRARGRDVALVCAGPDSDGHRARLERQAADLGLGDRVVFTGLVEGEALAEVYARADAAALVSRKENFGLAAADALAAGAPVVLSDGVDMGRDWPAPPVWRVAQTAEAVAAGLEGALDHARTTGLPSPAALALARAEWSGSPVRELADAFAAALIGRRDG